jgi:hypothetical protein
MSWTGSGKLCLDQERQRRWFDEGLQAKATKYDSACLKEPEPDTCITETPSVDWHQSVRQQTSVFLVSWK